MVVLQRVLSSFCMAASLLSVAEAETPDPSNLQISEWARSPLVQDPVALSFDHRGRLYVVESARRASVDIDIRAHKTWLLEDLANDDFESMRAFFRRRMAPELSDENSSWLVDRNADGSHDFRDLTTISERIRLIEDTDNDRRADMSTVFADGFQEEFTGVAAGVLPVDGDVLFTVYPDLWKLRDRDSDGKADERISMFRGFGVHAAFDGHDLHGLTVGPEGKIYFSCGDNGFSIVNKEGKRLHHPNTGGVLRMDPDGTNLEVFAIGLRNVQEFDFDQYGNMFGVDNDGDLEDERERAVYIAEGSDSGWRLNWQFRSSGWKEFNGGMTYNPWTAEGMWKPQHSSQPAYITPPMQNYSVGPGGFKFNPGTALNDSYRDFFFCVQFPVQQITAFRTQSRGAGFEMVDEHLFHGGLMASSVNFGPDGGFYIADWVGKWEPNEEGMIYRLDDPNVDGSEMRRRVQQLINHGLADQDVPELLALLGHPDRRVRQLSQFEMVRRKCGRQLLDLAGQAHAPQLARIHAMWGIIQLQDMSMRAQIVNELPWRDADPQIRQQCARVAGDLELRDSVSELTILLSDSAPLVRSHAAIALGKTGSNEAFEPLVSLLSGDTDEDPFIRHAGVMGLAGCANADQLSGLKDHDSSVVRMAAVLALRRLKSPQLSVYLDDADVSVLRETVRAIHDDFSIPAALPNIAKLIDRTNLPTDEPIIRRVLSANLRLGTVESAQRLVDFLMYPRCVVGDPLQESLQIEALECLAVWDRAPLVDRVEGRIRPRGNVTSDVGKQLLGLHLDRLLELPSDKLKARVTRLATELDLRIEPNVLKEWVLSEHQSVTTRVEALRALNGQTTSKTKEQMAQLSLQLTRSDETELRKTAYQILAEINPTLAWQEVSQIWNEQSPLVDQQLFISLIPQLNLATSNRKLKDFLTDLVRNQLDPAIALDVINAARASTDSNHGQLLQDWRASFSESPLAEFAMALRGGDAKRGEQLYRGHASAQCVRCHDAGGKGKQAGPDLSGIASRVTREHLLESIIYPNAKIAEGYSSVTLGLDDGRVLSGTVLSEEVDKITIGTPAGKTVSVSKDEIVDRGSSNISAMPDMTEVLTPMEVRDIIAYLATLRRE